MRHHRTQKSSKHKKIKAIDPFYTGPRREVLFKADKNANKPPSLGDGVQEIPRRLRDIATEQTKSSGDKPRRSGKGLMMHKRSDFKQGKYETLTSFYRRMDKAASEAITKAELEMQFDVHFDKKGKSKLTISKRKDPVMSEGSAAPALSKSQKRKQKLKQKLEEKEAMDIDEFDEMKDKFTFGEVVEAPPAMKSKPRKAPEPKKGGEKNLLLKKSLQGESDQSLPSISTSPSVFDVIPTITPSSVLLARQEQLRQESVQAYRQLKKQRHLAQSKIKKL